MKQYTIINESCLDAMDKMEENSIDAIVTDPPYEIGFMNKGWDNTGIAFSVDTWKKALRVLKPGGYLLAFNHSRTFHRMAVAIEDAGFQIRDTIMWLYGSGFPKSTNVTIQIDKKLGAMGHRGKAHQAYVVGKNRAKDDKELEKPKKIDHHKGITDQAKEWQGWGTALKPAYEPIIMARKPIEKSVADNVLKYGVGGINIDECRIENTSFDEYDLTKRNISKATGIKEDDSFLDAIHNKDMKHGVNNDGRFPANVIHDGSDEVVSGFPHTISSERKPSHNKLTSHTNTYTPTKSQYSSENTYGDSGSASRFFYTAKASKKDRNEGLESFEEKQTTDGNIRSNAETARKYGANSALRKNIHPTVKPTELMQYLVRLVAPKGTTILDIFMGSGSTGKAVMLENVDRDANYHFIGIDLEKEYCDIAKARIEWAINYKNIEIEKSEKRVVNDKEAKQLSIFDI